MADPSIKQLKELQSALNAAIDDFEASPSPDATLKINQAAQSISNLTKGPSIDFITLGYQPLENMCIRICIDLDMFNIIEERVPLRQIAAKTGADPVLLSRVLRLLVATKIFTEPELQVYSATSFSISVRSEPIRDWFKICFDSLLPIWAETPGWLRENGYQDITSLESNPTKTMYGKNFFDALAKDPRREADFAGAMKLQDLIPKAAIAQFPWDEAAKIIGQFLARLLNDHPGLPGRKIFQDLPSVVAGAKADSRFEGVGHDFFKPQPIKGARFYHLRGILHDWPDESCKQILTQIRDACAASYSSTLIHTYVLPEFNVGQREASNELDMWTCIGKERTKKDWEELLDAVGLKIDRIVMPEIGPMGIIETTPL